MAEARERLLELLLLTHPSAAVPQTDGDRGCIGVLPMPAPPVSTGAGLYCDRGMCVEIVRQLEAEGQFPQAHYAFDNGGVDTGIDGFD
jgi:hypothetical protein